MAWGERSENLGHLRHEAIDGEALRLEDLSAGSRGSAGATTLGGENRTVKGLMPAVEEG